LVTKASSAWSFNELADGKAMPHRLLQQKVSRAAEFCK
jgi:hypothetical protein